MGSGTDLTKQVADVVLVDNNFTSIVEAIEEGRRIYDNIQKFILYLLSCNSSEIYIMLIAVSAGIPVPFTPGGFCLFFFKEKDAHFFKL